MALPGIDVGPSPRARVKAGDAAEGFVEHLHRVCELQGVARVARVSTHLRLVAGGKVVPARKGTVDFLGCLRGGRMVAVEVKSCAAGRLDLDRLPPHQRAHLDAYDALGALALVLVVHGALAYAVPWPAVRAALLAGARSLGPVQLTPHQIDPRGAYLRRWAP